MQYRTARVEDAPQLAEINRQLIEEEWGGGGMSLQRLEDRMRRWLSDGEHRGYLFLEDGETVAYALLAMDEESAYIRHFFVLHEHRGRGIGRRAIDTLLREIVPPTARVTLDVLASNDTGRRFWNAVGFTDYSIRMERQPDADAR